MLIHQWDPFRQFEREWSRPLTTGSARDAMPMDAVRRDHEVEVTFDLPGVALGDVDLVVERNVLTVTANRPSPYGEGDQLVSKERRFGTLSRRIVLGDSLDGSAIEAHLDAGVLTLRIPVAERSKPQKVTVAAGSPAIEAAVTEPEDSKEAIGN